MYCIPAVYDESGAAISAMDSTPGCVANYNEVEGEEGEEVLSSGGSSSCGSKGTTTGSSDKEEEDEWLNGEDFYIDADADIDTDVDQDLVNFLLDGDFFGI